MWDASRRMQPTPLTGTATGTPGPQTPVHLQDAAHTPHGDGNASSWSLCTWVYTMQPTPLTGTATGRVGLLWGGVLPGMQPTPLTGTATELSKGRNASTEDAAHTPHGDGNTASLCRVWTAGYDAAHTPHGDGSGHEGRGKYQSGRKNTARVIFQSPVRCFLR